MRDVSASLLDESTPLRRDQNRFVLARAAEMWDEFWDDEVPHLSSLADRLAFAVPAISAREREGVDVLPKQFEAAWEAFEEAVDQDVGEAVLELTADVTPLAGALAARGTTLIHGDLRDENIGLPDGRLVLLDFGLASQGHPGWIFGHSAVVHTDPAEREWARTELNWWVPRVRHALEQWR